MLLDLVARLNRLYDSKCAVLCLYFAANDLMALELPTSFSKPSTTYNPSLYTPLFEEIPFTRTDALRHPFSFATALRFRSRYAVN